MEESQPQDVQKLVQELEEVYGGEESLLPEVEDLPRILRSGRLNPVDGT